MTNFKQRCHNNDISQNYDNKYEIKMNNYDNF